MWNKTTFTKRVNTKRISKMAQGYKFHLNVSLHKVLFFSFCFWLFASSSFTRFLWTFALHVINVLFCPGITARTDTYKGSTLYISIIRLWTQCMPRTLSIELCKGRQMDINKVLPLSEGEAIYSCSLAMGWVANNGVTGTDSTSSKINNENSTRFLLVYKANYN